MIDGLSHATVWCLDQQSAKAFYTHQLGFEVRTEAQMGPDLVWLTIGSPRQPDVQLILGQIQPPMIPQEKCATLRELVAAGTFGVGVLRVADCRATYEELRARGVTFTQEPSERPYGIEAILRDDSGNWWSMTQRFADMPG